VAVQLAARAAELVADRVGSGERARAGAGAVKVAAAAELLVATAREGVKVAAGVA
jgi:hypothetical protein